MKANEVSKVIKNTIIKKTWTNFQNKYLPKRFEKDYAVNVLGFRKRIRPKKQDVILIRSGNLRRMLKNSVKITDNKLTFELPTYASVRSWRVDQYHSDKLIESILKKVKVLSFRVIAKIVRETTGLSGKQLRKLVRKVFNIFKLKRKEIWFNARKSIKQELETIKEDEIVNSYNQIKEV